MSFDSFQLDPVLLKGVADLGFEQPTDIQQDAIPWALEGRDLLACAMTGSGKTAAFGLPILQRLMQLERGTTRALILSPTRELALQTEQHIRELAKHTDVSLASIFGGVGYEPQERAFRQGYDILVATPGRLLDLLGRPWANLDELEVLVLDEADRMLDMGFIPDVRRIVKHVPRERQTMLFSATLARPIVKLAGDMLVDPVTINLERRSAPAEGVRQAVYPVRHELKPALLLHLLQRDKVESALVFTRTKDRADLVGEYLRRAGIEVAVIHGDRTQQHRTKVMKGFKEGRHKVMVATDVAARGIDVEDLSHVINLDVPNQPDDYIHRVGRTARAGATGDAITFVAARELADLHLIEKTIGQKLERVRLESFDYSKSAAGGSGRVAPVREEVAAPEEVEEEGVQPEPAEEPRAAKPARGRAPRQRGRRAAAPEVEKADDRAADESHLEKEEDEVKKTDDRWKPMEEPVEPRVAAARERKAERQRGAEGGEGGEEAEESPGPARPRPELEAVLHRFAEIRARRAGRDPREAAGKPSPGAGAPRRETPRAEPRRSAAPEAPRPETKRPETKRAEAPRPETKRGGGRQEGRREPREEAPREAPRKEPARREPAPAKRRGGVDPEVLERYREAREYRREHGR